jgi:hypothetical protein
MRKLFSLFLVLVLSLSIVCAGAEGTENEYEFVTGDWLIVYGGGELELYLYIYEDGTFEEMFKEDVPLADDGSNTIPGTWTFDGKTLVLTAEGIDLPLLWNEEAHEFGGEADGVAVTVRMPVEAEPAAGMMAGGWYTGADPDITDEIKQLVATGLEEFVGVEYTPVTYLGSQVVAGTNYAILCQGRAVVPDAEPYWVILYLYQDLEGKVSVLGVVNLDLGV